MKAKINGNVCLDSKRARERKELGSYFYDEAATVDECVYESLDLNGIHLELNKLATIKRRVKELGGGGVCAPN